MRRLFTSLVAVAVVLAFSGMALAQAKQATTEKKPTAQAASTQAEKPAAPAKAKAEKASGTIKAASETSITLTTKEGDKEFMLDPKVVVTEGTKTLKTAELSSLIGQSAVVHFTGSGSAMTAHKVTVAKPKAEKKEAPKK